MDPTSHPNLCTYLSPNEELNGTGSLLHHCPSSMGYRVFSGATPHRIAHMSTLSLISHDHASSSSHNLVSTILYMHEALILQYHAQE